MLLYFLSISSMAEHRCPKKVTLSTSLSPEPIHGIPIYGTFNLDDFLLECFHFEKDCDGYYFVLQGHRVEIEPPIDLRVFQDTLLPTLFHVRG